MNTTYTWLNGLAGQIVEGASDAFLVTAGGSTVAAALLKSPAATLSQIGISMALGAAIYAASFLKSNPTPFTTVTTVPGTEVATPTKLAPVTVVPTIPVAPVEAASVAAPVIVKAPLNS